MIIPACGICRGRMSVPVLKNVTVSKDTTVRVVTHSKGLVWLNGESRPVNTDLTVCTGEYNVTVVFNTQTFPSFFIDHSVWDRVEALFAFFTSRLDEKGYVVRRPGNWIFGMKNAVRSLIVMSKAQRYMTEYRGGMLSRGATSLWEQCDPHAVGTAHLAMYDQPYGKSLCHARGCGPLYLLGRFCAGVYPTAVGYKTFAVEPDPGLYRWFDYAGRVVSIPFS